jgi:radical SAM superfamily enzyme YgiQ (UPF0313 family)
VQYHGNVIRPPSEAGSLILQVMYGCSHGECDFCGSYLGKPFRVRPFADIEKDVRDLPDHLKSRVKRVFLCDGDALALPPRRMVDLLGLLSAEFPTLERVSAYANAHSLLRLSPVELREIRSHGLELLYLGLESGDEETLAATGKGVTVEEQVEACRKAKAAGFALSVTVLLGLAAAARSLEHSVATGKALSRIDPEYIGVLSLMLEPGTRMYERVQRGEFVLPEPLETVRESREMLAATEVTDAVFRSNHASNYLPLRATLPQGKEALLRVLDETLAAGAEAQLKPEDLRAL